MSGSRRSCASERVRRSSLNLLANELGLEGAVGAPQLREAMGQHAARDELAEFLLDESRQAALVAAIRGYPEEGLQVLTNDGVEHGVLGVTEPIRKIEMRHTLA